MEPDQTVRYLIPVIKENIMLQRCEIFQADALFRASALQIYPAVIYYKTGFLERKRRIIAMQPYGVNQLRKMFLEFFESKGHLALKSFSLVPHNDKSLLLINSGMRR